MKKNILILTLLTVALFAGVEPYLDPYGMCTKYEATCSPDCSSVAQCSGSGLMPLLRSCYGSTPFCNLGQCTASYNPHCNQEYNPTFICPEEDGTFPDPSDCRRFHICLSGRLYSTYCGRPGLVFSTKTLSCVREDNENQCGKVICSRNNTWVHYSTDDRYAFECSDTGPIPGLFIQCPKNYVFEQETYSCEFKCNKEGLFPIFTYNLHLGQEVGGPLLSSVHPVGDPSFYIECSLMYGTEYIITKRRCPNDRFVSSIFDPKSSQCVQNKTQNSALSRIYEDIDSDGDLFL